MKKLIALILVIATAAVLLVGCADGKKITDHTWRMSLAQTDGGQIVAFDPASEVDASYFEGAKEVELILQAKGRRLTLTDNTSGKVYEGKFKKSESDEKTVSYTVKIGESKGTAVVTTADFGDGELVPTMFLSIGGYSMSFKVR